MVKRTALESVIAAGLQTLGANLGERIYHWEELSKQITPKFYSFTELTENNKVYFEESSLLFVRQAKVGEYEVQYRVLAHRAASWQKKESIELIGALRQTGPDLEECTLLRIIKKEIVPIYCLGVSNQQHILYSSANPALENKRILNKVSCLASKFPVKNETLPFNQNILDVEQFWKELLPILKTKSISTPLY